MNLTPHPLNSAPSRSRITGFDWLTGAFIAFQSSGFIQKYAGIPGLFLYLILVSTAIASIPLLPQRITGWCNFRFPILSSAFILGLAAIFLCLHQVEDGRGPGRSSDRDEGLEIAVSRLIAGENPYYPAHPDAGPLSVLPGAILLAVPFVLLGSVGVQNLFWLGAFLWICGTRSTSRGRLLVLLGASVALSPAAQYEIISGGDMIANGAYVACFLILAHDVWTVRGSNPAIKTAAALLLGVGLASRANMILILPLFSASVLVNAGWRSALRCSILIALAFCVTVGSFYVLDPQAFTPLKSREKIMFNGGALWWADEAILAVTATMTLVFAANSMFGRHRSDLRLLMRQATWVTITPMLAMVLLSSFTSGKPDFRFTHDRFGLMYLFFCTSAAVMQCRIGSASRKPENNRHLPDEH
jgi:hypothetical protein